MLKRHFVGRSDVDEMIRAALPSSQESTDSTRTVATKQKLDATPDETEPEAKKIKYVHKLLEISLRSPFHG